MILGWDISGAGYKVLTNIKIPTCFCTLSHKAEENPLAGEASHSKCAVIMGK